MSPISYYTVPDSYPPTQPFKWEEYVEQETEKCKQAFERHLSVIEGRLRDTGIIDYGQRS